MKLENYQTTQTSLFSNEVLLSVLPIVGNDISTMLIQFDYDVAVRLNIIKEIQNIL